MTVPWLSAFAMAGPSVAIAADLGPRTGYTATELRQLAKGMNGGPMSLAIAGVVVVAVVFFTLLVVAARQTSLEEEASEAQRAKRRAREHRAKSAESRVWRKTATTVVPVDERG